MAASRLATPDRAHGGGVRGLLVRYGDDDGVPLPHVGRIRGHDDVVDALDLSQRGGDRRRLGRVAEHLDRRQQSLRNTPGLEGLDRLVGRSVLGQRARAGEADADAEEGDHECPQRDHGDAEGDVTVLDHTSRPGGPGLARVALVTDLRPVDLRADAAQDGRGQGQRRQDAGQGDERTADADAAHERHREYDERRQPDGNGHAAEHHRAAGGLHGDQHSLVVVAAVVAFLTPAVHQDQRVVDGDAEPDEGDEELHDERHVGDIGQR